MYRVSAAIFTMPGFPCTILARIGLLLYFRGWGIRQLGISLVFFTSEAGSLRHFPLCAYCARVRSPSRRDSDFNRLIFTGPPSHHSAYQNSNLFTIVFLSKTQYIPSASPLLQLHFYPSSKWPLWIVHTAIPSDSGWPHSKQQSGINSSLLVTKLNLLVSFTFLVFGCVFRVLKAM